ncbi:hypothetical protein ANN_13305, partial [Periplaneta americana]
LQESECLTLEANIRWAEAFILMYSVTDKCSFDECNRLKFLINYNKRRRRLGSNSSKEAVTDVPVVLVGNKTDQWGDRMVSLEDGQRRSKEIGCVCFHEISVRESIEQVWSVFRDVCRFWKVHSKCPKLKRSSSDLHSEKLISPDSARFICTSKMSTANGTATPNGGPATVSPIMMLGTEIPPLGMNKYSIMGKLVHILKLPYKERMPDYTERCSDKLSQYAGDVGEQIARYPLPDSPKLYKNNPHTFEALENEIRRVICDISEADMQGLF